ncbi:MAG: cysteine desulfurase [Candidatus Methylacidiphilales bacterium]
MMKSSEACREDFPILRETVHGKPLIYFDNAATSQKPRQVIEAMSQFYATSNANVHRGAHTLSNRATEAYEHARQRLATFLGAGSAEEIVFTRGTTEGINLVARAWGDTNLHPGDIILLTQMEHHSNLVPWQLLAERTGATLAFIPVRDDGTLDLKAARNLLRPPVKILAFTHVSNSLGTINPAESLCALARAAKIVTLVDAAQSCGHMPLNVVSIGADFLVLSGHKMCGPTGIGVLWAREEMLAAIPPFHGGGEMIDRVTFESSTYKSGPHKFEAGTPAIAEAVGLAAAADYLDEIGRDRIFEHDSALTAQAWEGLRTLPGVRLLGPEKPRGALVSFVVDGVHSADLLAVADREGLALRGGHHCTQPLLHLMGLSATSRASFAFYNTAEEVDRMIEILRAAIRLLA